MHCHTLLSSAGRPDAEVAKEAWDRHLLRNQSFVVDNFQGQLKSKVVCPDCNRDSITFDPFMFLSVPLPQASKKEVAVKFTLVRRSGLKIPVTKYQVTVKRGISVPKFFKAVCKFVGEGLEPDNLAMAEIYGNRIFKVFAEDDDLDRVSPSDIIYVYEHESYEAPVKMETAEENEEEEDNSFGGPWSSGPSDESSNVIVKLSNHIGVQKFGTPLLMAFPANKVLSSSLPVFYNSSV